jgi:hypothetical protein
MIYIYFDKISSFFLITQKYMPLGAEVGAFEPLEREGLNPAQAQTRILFVISFWNHIIS